MDQVQSVISSVADDTLSSLDSSGEFIETAFSQVLSLESVNSGNSQARAKITGVVFELCLEELFIRFFPEVQVERHADLPEAGLVGNSAVDFLAYDSTGRELGALEAKGSPDQITTESGETISLSRPGMMRTDTVKKAVSLGYQINQTYNIPYYILTTDKPTSGSAKKTVDIAEGDVIQRVVDVTNPTELRSFRDEITQTPEYQVKIKNTPKSFSGRSLQECLPPTQISDIYIGSEKDWLTTIIEESSSVSVGKYPNISVTSSQINVQATKLYGSTKNVTLDRTNLSIENVSYTKGHPIISLAYNDRDVRL